MLYSLLFFVLFLSSTLLSFEPLPFASPFFTPVPLPFLLSLTLSLLPALALVSHGLCKCSVTSLGLLETDFTIKAKSALSATRPTGLGSISSTCNALCRLLSIPRRSFRPLVVRGETQAESRHYRTHLNPRLETGKACEREAKNM
ncbi:hypothetical protein E2C01_068458 [Portunus trituberculatus]|uniref:Uncharacterized protein n=1 Tax=Portunus trituberculatus TaxID=210409 RepID=A0A5B7HNW3_PORTR|nr:hypothetical protein [Portunus trituberculatus]